MAASRSISWTSGNAEKRAIHSSKSSNSRALLLALYELDDLAAHQINGRNQHGHLIGNSGACSCASGRQGLKAEVKDGSGERGIGSPALKDIEKSCAPPAAAGSNDWNAHGIGHCAASARNRNPIPVPSQSMEVSRISPAPRCFGLPRPSHCVAPGGLPSATDISLQCDPHRGAWRRWRQSPPAIQNVRRSRVIRSGRQWRRN